MDEQLELDKSEALDWLRGRTFRSPYAAECADVVVAEVETLRTRLSQIETRAQQIRGGLKPYARPVEIVDYLMGEQP